MFKKKKLLITGGTGSFGSTVVKYLLNTTIEEIRIFSRDEKKQEDMRNKFNDTRLKFYIGDVRDKNSVNNAIIDVNYIFHAAALKQVPSCEFYPGEAVKTNILGSENVINAAISQNVDKLVMLSTDKAVYPINAMGISKAMMEKLMVAKSRLINKRLTVLCATRYGNVMGSRGSVIPLFISQIKKNEPVTITDPAMTRFMMSLDESMSLVLYAFKNGDQGDIFVQKAPACNLIILVDALKDIFNSKSPIKIIGTRHGEKLFESLVSREEMIRSKQSKNYFTIKVDDRDLNYDRYFTSGKKNVSDAQDYTSHNTYQLNVNEVKKILLNLDFIKREINV